MIVCPLCLSPTHVIDSRGSSGSIRRRRKCLGPNCDHRFTTYEMVAPVVNSSSRSPSVVDVSGLRAKIRHLFRNIDADIADIINDVEIRGIKLLRDPTAPYVPHDLLPDTTDESTPDFWTKARRTWNKDP